VTFYDFHLWRTGMERYVETGRLYDTDTPGYYLPGSRSLYKYPPVFAAILRPFVGHPDGPVYRGFFLANLLILAAAFFLMMWAGPRRSWLLRATAFCLFAIWRPSWESLGDLQMEPVLLLLLAGSAFFLARGRLSWAAVLIGVAGAFKVYPWGLILWFAIRRNWRACLAGAAGALGTLATASLVIPPRHAVEFFFRILPRLGGTSLSLDNVSLVAIVGRLGALALRGPISRDALDQLYLEGEAGVGFLVRSVALLSALVVAYFGFRAFAKAWARSKRGSPEDRRGFREVLGLAYLTCALLFLSPTSWLSYQALLILPLLVVIFGLPSWKQDRTSWILAIAAAAVGDLLFSLDAIYDLHPFLVSAARSALPVLLGIAVLRRLGRGSDPAGAVTRTDL
jgi:hypothetical protein